MTSQFFTHPGSILKSYSRGSRLSISLSIARIFPNKHVCRRVAYGLAIIVSLIYAGDLLISALVCRSNDGPWYDLGVNHKNCLSRRGMPLRSVVVATAMDFIADILLIAAPLTMLWKVKLPKKERRLILALFSCNLFSLLSYTTFVLMGYLVVNLGPGSPIYWSIFGLVQVSRLKWHRCREMSNFSTIRQPSTY